MLAGELPSSANKSDVCRFVLDVVSLKHGATLKLAHGVTLRKLTFLLDTTFEDLAYMNFGFVLDGFPWNIIPFPNSGVIPCTLISKVIPFLIECSLGSWSVINLLLSNRSCHECIGKMKAHELWLILKLVSMAMVSTMRAPRIAGDWHCGNEIIWWFNILGLFDSWSGKTIYNPLILMFFGNCCIMLFSCLFQQGFTFGPFSSRFGCPPPKKCWNVLWFGGTLITSSLKTTSIVVWRVILWDEFWFASFGINNFDVIWFKSSFTHQLFEFLFALHRSWLDSFPRRDQVFDCLSIHLLWIWWSIKAKRLV